MAEIEANEERCQVLLNNSWALATSLVPEIGYETAAKVAKHALNNDLTVHEALKAPEPNVGTPPVS